MTYKSESEALDAEILDVIERWHHTGEPLPNEAFDRLARRIFEHQFRYNEPYAGYCARLGVTASPSSWEQIPAVPAPAFRDAALTTFDSAGALLVFHTSGTASGSWGRHYMETPSLYDAALLAGFDRFVLRDGARLRYLNLVPNPAENTHSSLGYMMARVAERFGDGRTGWYLAGNELLFDRFRADVEAAIAAGQPVLLAATAFALVHLLDAMQARRLTFSLPPHSRIMETGGFKGRSRTIERAELYARMSKVFNVSDEAFVSEYGMTELSSQYYARGAARRFVSPPWLRVRVVGPERHTLPMGEIGSLLHVDLANRSSCVAIQTEDLGLMTEDGLQLLGRERDASPRGCSLDAEALRAGGGLTVRS
jgi:hypothetical protein